MTLLQCSGSDTAGGVQTKEGNRTVCCMTALSNVCVLLQASRSLVGAMSVQAILTALHVHAAMCATETCRRSWRVEHGDVVERCSCCSDKLTCSSRRYFAQVRMLATTDLQVVLVIFAQMLRLSKVDCWSCSSLRAHDGPDHASAYSALPTKPHDVGVCTVLRILTVRNLVVLA